MLPSGSKIDVSIGENAWASIKCGKSQMRIPGMAADAFPEFPDDTEFAPVATANLKALARSLGRVMHAVIPDKAGTSTSSVGVAKLDIGLDKTVIVATDGHRLPLVEADIKGTVASVLLVPSKAAAEFIRLSGTAALDTKVTIAIAENTIMFSVAGGWTLYAKMQSAVFPDYRSVVGGFKTGDGSATVSAKGLKDCVSRVRGFATGETRTITFTIGDGVLKVYAASADSGEATEEIECECSGSITAIFNAGYIMDFIASCSESESIRIEFGVIPSRKGSSGSAFRFMPAEKRDGESYSEIIMPIHA